MGSLDDATIYAAFGGSNRLPTADGPPPVRSSGRITATGSINRSAGISWYDITDMMRLFDVCDRTIWKWVAQGKLPEPKRRGPKWSRWPRVIIDALIDEMINS